MTAPAEKPWDGKIPSCPHMGCEFKCCSFNVGNYIVTYPGELENAVADGQSVAHLRVIDDDDNGGKRAICEASSCADCDGGYKPLDCASYPLFPDPDRLEGRQAEWIRGEKCPLPTEALLAGEASFADRIGDRWVKAIMNGGEPVLNWLRQVKMVGYSRVE